MRLLKIGNDGSLSLTEDLLGDDMVPPYAILSHTWREEEVTFDDMIQNTGNHKAGYAKIQFCTQEAVRDGLRYCWIDTCCINKADVIELQDAINSMFRWYQAAAKCYVFLSDVSIAKQDASSKLNTTNTWELAFRTSRWFTRGWTLPELLAPRVVQFFSQEGERLGDRFRLQRLIHEITNIPVSALTGTSLDFFTVKERLSWSENRHTTRKEDKVYSLLGMFGVCMPLLYGEGENNAFRRLRKEIDELENRQGISDAHTNTPLRNPAFLDWLNETKSSEHPGHLWAKGNPGAGKSVLMASMMANDQKTKEDTSMPYFYFDGRDADHERSPTSRRRTAPEIGAVREFGLYLGQLEELRPLHEEASKKLRGPRFQENYRRILKLYALRLMREARTSMEKDTALVLKSRFNRLQIAQRIEAFLLEDEEDIPGSMGELMAQPIEKQSLEDWARNTYASSHGNVDTCEQSSDALIAEDDSDDDDDSGDHTTSKELQFPIGQAKQFLHRGIAFQNLHLDLRLLVLPASIREVIESIPKGWIHTSSLNDVSLMNRLKLYIEEHTNYDWDWWPLRPSIPHVSPGMFRLQWKFCGQTLYKSISPAEADSVRRILEMIDDHPPRCFCCGTDTDQNHQGSICRQVVSSITQWLSWKNSSVASAPQKSPSKAAQLYTPIIEATTNPSPALHSSPTTKPVSTGNNNGSDPKMQCNGSSARSTIAQQGPLWVTFGLQGKHHFNIIENIKMSISTNDPSFFQELNSRHKKHRWILKRWFSPFRFRHCQFVRFETLNTNQVYCSGEALPDDHGHTDDYEYDPRPPRVTNPLINRKLFSICLNACNPECSWSLLPDFLHTCHPLPCNSHNWKRIPRKKSAFDACHSQPGEVAFGLEADYALSFAVLFVYQAILLCSAFGFWVYWLFSHPGDLQNASVPTFTVLGLMGALWGLFARRIDSR